MNILFSEQIRPTSIDELIINSEIRTRLQKMIDNTNVLSMIFFGNPGSGKSSTAKIFANSGKFDSIFVEGSAKTSPDDIRKIESFASAFSLVGGSKLIIIDEADLIPSKVQSALRTVVEKFSDNCRFILTANKIEKVDYALRSRMLELCFNMPILQIEIEIQQYSKRIIDALKLSVSNLDETKVKEIISSRFPDCRDIANRLQFEFF